MWPTQYDAVVVIYEWEIFREGDLVGPCGMNELQSTAMDRLSDALRALGSAAWGRISSRTYTYGMPPYGWSTRVLIRADLDETGSISWSSVIA